MEGLTEVEKEAAANGTDISGFYCFKDLACGNIDKSAVEAGCPCGDPNPTPCDSMMVKALSLILFIIFAILKH